MRVWGLFTVRRNHNQAVASSTLGAIILLSHQVLCTPSHLGCVPMCVFLWLCVSCLNLVLDVVMEERMDRRKEIE